MKLNVVVAVVVSFALSSFTAYASFTASGSDPRQILREQNDVREEISRPMGKYSRFNESAQARIRRAQEVIFGILGEEKPIESLPKDQQVSLLNAVEEVKAVIANNQADKLQCWRERKTGTTLRTTRCATVAQRERLLQDARAWKGDPSICIPLPSGISCGQVRP